MSYNQLGSFTFLLVQSAPFLGQMLSLAFDTTRKMFCVQNLHFKMIEILLMSITSFADLQALEGV